MWYLLSLLSLAALYAVDGYVTCDFENTGDRWCSFYQQSNNVDWILSTGRTNSSYTRPIVDHTTNTTSGNYLVIESSFPANGADGSDRKARLLSTTLATGPVGSPASDFCLKFYYHMWGPPDQELHIIVKEHGQAAPSFSQWRKSGSTGDVWTRQMMNISASGGLQVIFEAIQGTKYHGDISIDDIAITEGRCPYVNTSDISQIAPNLPTGSPMTRFECNLDYADLCGFKAWSRNPFNWQWRGNTYQPAFGPTGDHTSGSSTGYFLYVTKDESNQEQEQRIRTISPLFTKNTASKCMSFAYFMNGNNVGTLNGYVVADNVTLPIEPTWSRNISTSNRWLPAFLNISQQHSNYRVVFEAIRGINFDGCIAIDDFKLTDEICPTVNASNNFEDNGIGNFIQDQNDDMDWRLIAGYTWSWQTGPAKDHTYGNSSGHYVHIETSYPARKGHVARLLSPVLLATTTYPRCLTFWYHMYGTDVEALIVYIVNGTQSDHKDILWSRSGNRGNRWRAAEVTLESSINFQVVFEAEAGEGYRGDIAIDDIVIEADDCPGHHHYKNYSSITCDFEEAELCYYKQEPFKDDIDFQWINSDYAAYYVPVGPDVDQTRKDELGFYLYVTFSHVRGWYWFSRGNQKARIYSPYSAPQSRSSCVEFWYHMYGRDTESLKVYLQQDGQDIPDDPAWEKSGDQGDYWHRATVDIELVNTKFRIVFEATTGRSTQDDIAIDEVTFHENACPPHVTPRPPPITLPSSRNNASCNFDDRYLCNYTQAIRDNLDWSWRNSNSKAWYRRYYGFGPKTDHTKQNNKGFYMNFDCWYWYWGFDYRAIMETPYLSPHDKPKCVHFYYYMYGYGVDFLNLYIKPFGSTLTMDPQLSFYGNKGDQWNHGMMDLPPIRDPYIVVFEATKGRYWACDIALDDVIFMDGACPKTTPTPLAPTAGNCDFESNQDPWCGYEQDTKFTISKWGYHYIKDDFDWTLNSGNTSSPNTGPTGDHTVKSAKGHYVYIESSLPRRPFNIARLISPVIEGSDGKICIQFYYHMKGSGIGNLNLYFQSGVSKEQKIKSLVGEQGDNWKVQTVELEPFPKEFQLIFEASVGRVTYGDIAVDDITILRQPCEGHEEELECSFNLAGDWCGYIQSAEDDLNWQWYDINKGSPPINKTVDKGYIYVSGGSNDIGKIARLSSRPTDGRSSQHCLEFDYYLPQNSSSSKLTIAVKRNDGDQVNIMTLLVDEGNDEWKHKATTLTKADIGEKFQVVFIGVLGENNGVIGLDNPTVSLGSCDDLPGKGRSSSSRSSGNATSSVATFFGILSAFLIILMVLAVAYYLYRKRNNNSARYTIRYDNKDTDNNEMKSVPKQLTIENPLYSSDPPAISTAVSFDNSQLNGSS